MNKSVMLFASWGWWPCRIFGNICPFSIAFHCAGAVEAPNEKYGRGALVAAACCHELANSQSLGMMKVSLKERRGSCFEVRRISRDDVGSFYRIVCTHLILINQRWLNWGKAIEGLLSSSSQVPSVMSVTTESHFDVASDVRLNLSISWVPMTFFCLRATGSSTCPIFPSSVSPPTFSLN